MSAIDQDFLREIAERARGIRAFSEIRVVPDRLDCRAAAAAAEAWYRIARQPDGWYLSLVTPDRWLSESIEADLVHTGDSLDDLFEEELVEHGVEQAHSPMKHFRSDDMLYTFLVRLPEGHNPELISSYLLAFEATFRNLGDMSASEEQE